MIEFIGFNYLVENGLLGQYGSYCLLCVAGLALIICGLFAFESFADGEIATGVVFGLIAVFCLMYLIYSLQTWFPV